MWKWYWSPVDPPLLHLSLLVVGTLPLMERLWVPETYLLSQGWVYNLVALHEMEGKLCKRSLRGKKLTRKREWGRRNTVLYCCVFNICFYAFYPKCAHKMFWVRLRFLIKYFVIKNTYLHLLQCWPMRQHGNSRWKSFCTRGPIALRWGTKRNKFSLIIKKRKQLPSWKVSSWQPSNPKCVSGFKTWEYSRSCSPPLEM